MIAHPNSQSQASQAFREALAERRQVLPFGLGQSLGQMVEDQHILALSSRDLPAVVSIEPDNLLAVVGAGITVDGLDRALAGTGLYWPVTGPHGRSLGGIMGQGLLGAEAMARGTMCDWILGTTMLTPQGEIVSSGGRTLKNVSGYDLTRMCWRARGSLAMSLSFTVKLVPRPSVCPAMEFKVRSLRAAAGHMEAIIRERLGLQALRLIGDKDGLRLVAWLCGFPELVASQEERLKGMLGEPSDLFEDGFEYFNHSDAIFSEGHCLAKVFAGPRKALLGVAGSLSWIGEYSFVLDLGGGRMAFRDAPGPIAAQAAKAGLAVISGAVFKAVGPLFRRLKANLDPRNAFLVL
ncbi:MAG: FAD-binding oxidoreductase [Deltaproteobacteria bacterium]|jgi:FAD/FMN-containing dehydrogenase|nr:FAD-binding oxidoreductase [Deltaproteobacteria bacterium]